MRNPVIVLALVVVALVYGGTVGCSGGSGNVKTDLGAMGADDSLAMAKDRHEAGDIAGAIEAYRSAIAKNPRLVDARYNLAVLLRQEGDEAGALEEIGHVVELNPSLAGAHTILAELRYAEGDLEGAAKASGTAVELDPSSTAALQVHAESLAGLGRYAEAVKSFERFMSLSQFDKKTTMSFARSLVEADQPRRAIDLLTDLLHAGDDSDHLVKLELGAAYNAAGLYDDAREVLQKVVVAREDDARARLLLGRAYLERGEQQMAVIELQKASGLDPSLADAFVALGEVELKRGYPDRALSLAEKAISIEDKSVSARLLLGDVRNQKADRAGAEKAYAAVLELRPRHRGAALRLSRLFVESERPREAAEVLERALADSEDEELTRRAASAWSAAGSLDKAVPLWDKLASKGDLSAAKELVGARIESSATLPGVKDEAVVKLAEKVHKSREGGSVESMLAWVDVLVAKGDKDAAKQIIKDAPKKFKRDKAVRQRLKKLR